MSSVGKDCMPSDMDRTEEYIFTAALDVILILCAITECATKSA